MESQFQPYESEIPKIEAVLRKLNYHKPKMGLLEFGEAVEEEFGLANIKAYVLWHFRDGTEIPHSALEVFLRLTVADPGVPLPEIVLVDRIKPLAEFDHERMAYEVQNEILGLGTPGSIGRNGIITPPKSTAFISKKD